MITFFLKKKSFLFSHTHHTLDGCVWGASKDEESLVPGEPKNGMQPRRSYRVCTHAPWLDSPTDNILHGGRAAWGTMGDDGLTRLACFAHGRRGESPITTPSMLIARHASPNGEGRCGNFHKPSAHPYPGRLGQRSGGRLLLACRYLEFRFRHQGYTTRGDACHRSVANSGRYAVDR